MRPIDFDVQKIIDTLQGTCDTLDSAIETHYPEMLWEDLTSEDHQAIDLQIFQCVECGWWCEISQLSPKENDELKCEDCDPEEED